MKQKIVLEVVPWIDNTLRSGWTIDKKKEIQLLGEKSEIAKKVANTDLFLGNFINLFIAKYSYDAYKKLLTVEKTTAVAELAEESLIKSGQLTSYLDTIRKEATQFDLSNKSTEGITLIQKEIIDKNRAVADDYFLLGSFYLSSKQFAKAEEALLKATEMNKSDVDYQLKLAHVYLFTNQFSKAKTIHKEYKNNSLSNSKTWTEQTKIDFEKFQKNGFDTENFKKILRILD